LRHDGLRERDKGPSQGPHLLLAGGSLGVHRRPADRRRPPNPPWKGPRPRGAAAGSGLRAPSLPRGSRSGGAWSAWAGPTPERIARISRMIGKISSRWGSASERFSLSFERFARFVQES